MIESCVGLILVIPSELLVTCRTK